MHIECYDDMNRPIVLPACRVVVFDDFNNPIAIALRRGNGWCVVHSVTEGQDKFNVALREFGFNKTLIVDKLDTKKLPILVP
jgi:hypothetical protein